MGMLKSIALALLISCSQSIAADKTHYAVKDLKPADDGAVQSFNDLKLQIMENLYLDDEFLDDIDFSKKLKPASNEGAEEGKVKPIEQDKIDAKSKIKDESKQEVVNTDPTKSSKEKLAKRVFAIATDDIVLGNSKAPVLIIEYTALTCPHCAHYHTGVYEKIKTKYIDPGKVAYIVRNVVWSKQDMDSAILARCDQNKFTAFSNVLYARQRSWAFARNYQDILTNIGQLGGISVERYSKCLNDDKLKDSLILKTKQFAEVLDSKLIPTPAIIVNGKLLQQHSFEEIAAEIDKNLHESSLAYHE